MSMDQNTKHTDGLPSAAEEVTRMVREVLNSASCPQWEALPEHLRAVEGAERLHAEIWGLRELAQALARGDLQHECAQRGYVIGGLKGLQSSLRHLTWQTQRIAQGEYTHRVEFLGEFSAAFNHMTEQLGNTVSELHVLTEKYKNLSLTDALTGALNRNGFGEEVKRELPRVRRGNHPLGLVVADIDFFKKVNDSYGHLAGDVVLTSFVHCLRENLREPDSIARLGGEEFVLLLPETGLEEAISTTERLQQAVACLRIEVEGQVIPVTASFGVTVINKADMDTGHDKEAVLNYALERGDTALYEAKQRGRNRVVAHQG